MYFTYNEGGSDIPEGAFKISPSQLSKFFSDTPQWYREHVLEEDSAFTGNTNSMLGNCVHGLAEMRYTEGAVDHHKVEEYLSTITDPEIDLNYIRQQYGVMADCLLDNVVDRLPAGGKAEPFLWYEVIPGYGVGGSLDMLQAEEIRDYKTTGAMSPPKSIPRSYWFQQMSYVWLAKKHGYNIKRFVLDYITHNNVGRISPVTGKPMKDYPTTHTPLVHEVTDTDLEIIDNTLRLVSESVKAFKEKPEISYLLAQDLRLKKATKFAH